MIFVCPKCKEKLNICDTGAAVCPNRHSYDRAKEGYYNLLLSRGGGTHGDNAEMVEAR
jgi:23S rRNA (guanine745-N1)-methyltransferase